MPNLLAMSFEGQLAPSLDLSCLGPGRKLPDGWGLGYFPGGEPYAQVLKEPAPPHGSIRSEIVKAWEHLESSIFVVHIRQAKWGLLTDANTQPLVRSYGGRDWLVGHSGSLKRRLDLGDRPRFEPVGSTDTERVFCDLLGRIAARGYKSLGDVPAQELHAWLSEINALGDLTIAITDGHDLAVYADRNSESRIFLWQLMPPYGAVVFGDDDLVVDLTSRGIKSRKGVVVCSDELLPKSDVIPTWQRLDPGRLVVVRQGAIVSDVGMAPVISANGERQRSTLIPAPRTAQARPQRGEVKRFLIEHRASYAYAKRVERSTHVIRLTPSHDRLQSVARTDLRLSVSGPAFDYDDVFGNAVRRIIVETPFDVFDIEAVSEVEVLDIDPLRAIPIHAKRAIPLVWMPWQRHMLKPYLPPPELPESMLAELAEYAMSFVARNDSDLLDTLLDINRSIFDDYTYAVPQATGVRSAFDTYASREGGAREFVDLFLCLTRLLGVPARYVCGYVDPAVSQRVGPAHAWAQVYLPEVGWRGFDPTHGVLTQTDHVRVSVGRTYVDANPTSGTILVGGGPETRTLNVKMVRLA